MLKWDLSPPLNGAEQGDGMVDRYVLGSQYVPQVPHTAAPRAGAYINVLQNNNLDLGAPGVRDNVANPTLFGVNQYRTELFDPQHTVNPAPIPNWSEQSDMITNPQAQRLGAYWWKITRGENAWQSLPWKETGTFIVPKVGFSSLKDLRPASVYQFV